MGDRIARSASERASKRVVVDHTHQTVSDGLRPRIVNEDAFRTALQDFTGSAGSVGCDDAQACGERLDDSVGIALVTGGL